MSSLISCPLCKTKGTHLYNIKRQSIIEKLEFYYSEKLPRHLVIRDYQMLRCDNCRLEYSIPLKPGNRTFYNWITSHEAYYPHRRWEWSFFLDRLKLSNKGRVRLLEVGCGAGAFLEMALTLPDMQPVGLDTNMTAVATCRAKGLQAHCEPLDSFIGNRPLKKDKFDFIVSFHCLEHVSDPLQFVSCMLSGLKPRGSVFLSTPYSPMSFENLWFDPLNHPPHHLTRWNSSSHEELARRLGVGIKFYMPPSKKAWHRTTQALELKWRGPHKLTQRRKFYALALCHPLMTSNDWLHQLRRERFNGRTAADVVLVELSPRSEIRNRF
jgi:2-polyprenyl-3-methyl-5-hydroxy-6-metoxy-1,4-benzoquinol methylase